MHGHFLRPMVLLKCNVEHCAGQNEALLENPAKKYDKYNDKA